MNSRSEATLAPLGCLFDSASVKWFPGIPGEGVSIILSVRGRETDAPEPEPVVADKGYHSGATVQRLEEVW